MTQVNDLNIEKELLPLFDYALNESTKAKILEILKSPLPSVSAIKYRHKILKGFQSNNVILKDYSYVVLYFNEVHFFLNNIHTKKFHQTKFRYHLFTAKKEKVRNQNKLSEMVLFFHHLCTEYLASLNLNPFPDEYRKSMERMLSFLDSFELNRYESIIREKGLKDKQVLELMKTVYELGKKGHIKTFWEDFILFEAYQSLTKAITVHGFEFPDLSEGGIELTDFYHPLLKNPEKNKVKIQNNVIVLNGPNMSGKSTLLRAVGLCIYLGHLGIGIPAASGTFPFFDYFFIKINRSDDILNGYSHFMTEIVDLKMLIEKARHGQRCFVIFDELFSGTNQEDAVEISRITLKGLVKFSGSYFFISTHLQQLKKTSDKISDFYLDCELKEGKPVFTYKIKSGWSDIQVGKILFEREGLYELLKCT